MTRTEPYFLMQLKNQFDLLIMNRRMKIFKQCPKKRPAAIPILSNLRTSSSVCKFSRWFRLNYLEVVVWQGSRGVKSNFNLIKYHQTWWNNIKSSSKAVSVRWSVDNILSRDKIENFKLLAEALYLYLCLKAKIIIGWDLKECELIHLNDQNNIEIWH